MEHPCSLARRIGDLLFDGRTSDVVLVVEGEHFPAHRAIVATSSEYFRALLLGNMKESIQNEVVLKDIPIRGFKLLMSYIYTGQLKLKGMNEETILGVLELAHLYGLEELQHELCQHFEKILSVDNVCAVFNTAHRLQLKGLHEACRRIIFRKPRVILKSTSFAYLSKNELCQILSADSFCTEEIEIFKAVARWCAKHHAEEGCSEVLKVIRLPLITVYDLVNTVMNSGMFAPEAIVNAIRWRRARISDTKLQSSIGDRINLASLEYGARKLKTYSPEELSTTTKCPFKMEGLLPRYPSEIKINAGTGLTIALKEPSLINHVAFKFSDDHCHSYYIEVSMDLEDWVRVIDYRKYLCRSFQNLYFDSVEARFIRLISMDKGDIAIRALVVTRTIKRFKLTCGFYAPEGNMAKEALGSLIGIEREKNGSGVTEFVIADSSAWMAHEIGKGSIRIRFPQPYTINSMRMLLGNEVSRTYKYYIETSLDLKNWRRVADIRENFHTSWQGISFDSHAVLCIKIVCTGASVGKIFKVSRLECPASAESQKKNSPAQGSTRSSILTECI